MGENILYIQTSGFDTPERLYAPLVVAQSAKAMDIEAAIFFTLNGVLTVKKGEAEKIKLGNLPSLAEVLKKTIEMGVDMYVCDQSTQLLGLDRGNYVDGVKVVGAVTMNDLALEADAVITF
ncbi:MAG: DsrE family protein [Thermoplasmata archaeon]|nr:DsrE family protein [Thermoplasmata archaeon]